MAAEGLEVAQLTPSTVERFLAERRRLGYVVMVSPRGTGPLFGYLEGLGVLEVEEVVRTSAQVLLEDFRSYLLNERGLQHGFPIRGRRACVRRGALRAAGR